MLKLYIVVTSVTYCISHIMYLHIICSAIRSVDSMYIHTELDMHIGVYRSKLIQRQLAVLKQLVIVKGFKTRSDYR